MHCRGTVASLTLIIAILTAAATAQSPLRRSLRPDAANRQVGAGTPVQVPNGLGSNPFFLVDYPRGMANQFASGINDKGKIVGLVNSPDGSCKGYLQQGKTFRDIVFPGSPLTAAFGINTSGLIVGAYCSDISCGTGHGFTLKGTTYTSIDFPGGMNTEAIGVNAAGDIVGSYQSSDFVVHGFLLHNGLYTTFDAPGSVQTLALSINKQGTIVGGFTASDGSGHGFILQGGIFTQVDYPGGADSELTGINDGGDIVGVFSDPGIQDNHAFLLSGGVFTAFNVPFPGSISTIPWGLNNHHQIVGSYGSFPPDYFFGFLTAY